MADEGFIVQALGDSSQAEFFAKHWEAAKKAISDLRLERAEAITRNAELVQMRIMEGRVDERAAA